MRKYQGIISLEQLHGLIENESVRIIDVRFYLGDIKQGRNEYMKAHIPSASYLHLDEDLSGKIIPGITGRHPLPSKLQFVEKLENIGIDQDTQVVIYDQGPGGIAARLWWLLQWLGHDYTAVLNGGWAKWEASGAEIETEVQKPVKSFFHLKRSKVRIVVREGVEEMINDKTACIVDSRLAERYRGEIEPIDPIAGHIPNAENFPFPDNLSASGEWKSKKELEKRFTKLFESHKASDIAVYCGSGVTACHNLLAMHYAGFEVPLLYAPSWSGWITRQDAKVSVGD